MSQIELMYASQESDIYEACYSCHKNPRFGIDRQVCRVRDSKKNKSKEKIQRVKRDLSLSQKKKTNILGVLCVPQNSRFEIDRQLRRVRDSGKKL